jgi:hypothetical protein
MSLPVHFALLIDIAGPDGKALETFEIVAQSVAQLME